MTIMTTENPNNETGCGGIFGPETVVGETLGRREPVKGEKLLLAIGLITAILCDRLFLNIAMKQTLNLCYYAAIFEICFIVLYCVFNREKLYNKPLLWAIAGMVIPLCVWNFIFDYVSDYGVLTFFVIPATLMMFTQLTANSHRLKDVSGMAASWFSGWFVKPFSAVNRCAQVLAGILFPENKKTGPLVKKITAAVLITVPLAVVLVALLSGADMMFKYYVDTVFAAFDPFDFALHAVLVTVGFLLFYSFFWNGRYGKAKTPGDKEKKGYKADNLIMYIILGTVLLLYVLFCTIQFTYLFAGAGLPEGISYSDYAREGFAQIVAVSGINLLIFGCALKYGKIHGTEQNDTALRIMLCVLVLLTWIMLASGFVRLGLYIDTFGMTFLRLISAWFMIYLALVLVLCAARLIEEKVPLIACCAVLLLFAYNVLGYMNPDAFIMRYNLKLYEGYEYNNKIDDWVEYTFNKLSDDALVILLDKGLNRDRYAARLKIRYDQSAVKRSVASVRLTKMLMDKYPSAD